MSKKIFEQLKDGFFRGIGWAVGVSLGFAFVSTVLLFVLSRIDTLPVIGNFVASVVEATVKSLAVRSPQL